MDNATDGPNDLGWTLVLKDIPPDRNTGCSCTPIHIFLSIFIVNIDALSMSDNRKFVLKVSKKQKEV